RRLDEAIKEYKEALRIDKDNPMAHYNLGNAFKEKGLLGDAIDAYREAIRIKKDYAEAMDNLGIALGQLGQFAEALKLHEKSLAILNAKLGPDHPKTLMAMWCVIDSLINLGRGSEALPIIDECLKRAAGKDVYPDLNRSLMRHRLRHFEETKDAAGCQATAEMWERQERTDAGSLYAAACFRAVTAAILRGSDKPEAATRDVVAQADRAMAWLKQAVDLGYKDAAMMKTDKDF